MDREQASLLALAANTIRFATDHPYAATGIFGAAVGSAVTYKVLTLNPKHSPLSEVFTPKMYQLELKPEDLRRMLMDPKAEIRYEMTDMTVVVTSEQREVLRALPDIVQ